MYIINKDERNILISIMKNARADFLKANDYIFNEETIEDKVLYSEKNVEDEVIESIDAKITANNFEEIFANPVMFKKVKALAYRDKLVLYLYFQEEQTDNDIAESFSLPRSTLTSRRHSALEKLGRKRRKK